MAPSAASAVVSASELRATVGLAKVALARNENVQCLSLLAGLPEAEPAVLQMRGEAHAALGELETARLELSQVSARPGRTERVLSARPSPPPPLSSH